ncbi:alpha/beta hydrolase [Maricaulis sp.]|uniref:alpha/beta hydrolase family protein n=1 Tax=Maricaulis sp. TaxID=1486257 RepID=UPI0032987736
MAGFKPVLAFLVTGALAGTAPGALAQEDMAACHAGSYRLDSGAVLDIGLLPDGTLRWRTIDGRSGTLTENAGGVWSGNDGWSDQPHPARIELGGCDDDTIAVHGIEHLEGPAQRIAYSMEETRFQGGGVELAGRLILPPGEGPFPLAVLVHGSESYSALDYAYYQRLLPAQGVASFVYDKRGTGASTGEYTQDFHLLAADAAAAFEEARRVAGDRIGDAGYLGGSQGGWVSPLAATMSEPDFLMVGFGLAEGPLAEDREEVRTNLVEAGYSGDVLETARTITDITGRVMASGFTDGLADLERVKAIYAHEAWFNVIEGEFTGEMLHTPLAEYRAGYAAEDVGTSWEYEPMPVLRQLDIPILWVLAGADREAPADTTRALLSELQSEGQPIDIAWFPGVDHGITRFVEDEAGERTTMGYADGYFRLLADWPARYGFDGPYGDAELAPHSQEPDE